MSTNVENSVLDAIQLLADAAVKKAAYDRTIQAQILSCEDATIGKYRCRYQDSIFYAFSNNADMNYTNNSYVYILVPGNDMSKEKQILGSVNKLGINYISQLEKDQRYTVNGTNGVTSDQVYFLDTNNITYSYKIYDYNNVSNDVTLDIESIQKYIKQSSSLIVGANFTTSIPVTRQYRGHYGIKFNLRFIDNVSSQQQVIRSYIVDEDNMIDNPYRLIHGTRQYEIFDIDGPHFVRVESIQIFNKDFPNAEGLVTTGRLTSGDIIISDLEIKAAVKIPDDEINGISITFYTPSGTFFNSQSTSSTQKPITAQVRVKGKLVSSTVQNIPFYWGCEHAGIGTNSPYYNTHLGRGWKCLNSYNIIQNQDQNGNVTSNSVVEWVPASDTYIVTPAQATARDNKFKVAIVYDGTVVTKTINIQNYASETPILTIESSQGTKFYYDIGHPTLTCKVDGEESNAYNYYWAYESNTGVFQELPETTTDNTAYVNAVAALNQITSQLNVSTFPNAEHDNLIAAQQAVERFNFIQRVERNKVYDVQIRNITNFGIFKCSVYNSQDLYLGTASIKLVNLLQSEDLYSLIINNGSETFQYDESGVAPNSKRLDTPQLIQQLSFSIYDNLGNSLTDEVISNPNNCKIRWEVPIKDTMIVDKMDNIEPSGLDPTGTYRYYDEATLTYDIAQNFNVKHQRNQIYLTINFKGLSLTAKTDFTFIKQGQPGTNGTDFVVKIVPNTVMNNPPLWPMITHAGSSYIVNYGIGSNVSETVIGLVDGYQLFKAQLWHSGDLVWEGFSAATAAIDGLTRPTRVYWEVLKNKYGLGIDGSSSRTFEDDTSFEVTDASTGSIKYLADKINSTSIANIIKCSITWEGKLYYATMPVITAWTTSQDYRVQLKDYTGFRYVTYSSDGMFPQYDNLHPFEFICKQRIGGYWEDVSNAMGEYAIDYTPSSSGNIQVKSGNTFVPNNTNLLTLLTNNVYRSDLLDNQWLYRPSSVYNGECVNEAVTCNYLQDNQLIGRIHIPIHFLLNKYGLGNINAWDGNSIQINDEGGYILSPQMGAGVKNNDNSFTGVLMGEVKTPEKSSSDIGLMGYSSGDRTFFLNSENGSALLGKKGNGQIVLDPDANKALLYSDGFWTNYDEDGLPSSYERSNENSQGLLIDLTTPEIRFGNGKFIVNNSGAYIRGNIVLENGTNQGVSVEDAISNAVSNIQGVSDALVSDTIHHLATSAASGVTTSTQGWDVNTELTPANKYLWTYHTYTKADGTTQNTTPIITGVYGDKGEDGTSGQDNVRVEIESSVGTMFLNTYTEAILTCHVYRGTEDITDQVTQFRWVKKDRNGNIDNNWSALPQQSITIDSNDINAKAIFICNVEF